MSEDYEVAIIGTGFSGLCMALALQKAGIDSFVILEKADDVGGTWRENTYPGCECDVQSHLYSLSTEGNPDWSRTYAGQAEILAYIERCFDEHDLRHHIRFGANVVAASFDEAEARWQIRTEKGSTLSARIFILGTGPLHVPSVPDIPGLETFEGTMFHSARWDHSFDFEDKVVASIGTGGSAIQYVPQIAPQVRKLHVFQRSAPWIIPRIERAYTELEKRAFRAAPILRKIHRSTFYWRNEARVLPIMAPRLARLLSRLARLHMRAQLKDPALVAKMTPDYTMGCKRVLVANNYYPTFNRRNVELVTDRITAITKRGVKTEDDRERPVDAIVLGTGFVTDPRIFLRGFSFQGLGGREILDVWKNGAEAYLGMTVIDFPNLFLMIGPNTGLGHNSLITMMEAQAHYILECLRELEQRGAKYMVIKRSEMSRFNEALARRLDDTAWSSGCNSWYTQDDGKNIAIWPGFTFRYRAATRRVATDHYEWVS